MPVEETQLGGPAEEGIDLTRHVCDGQPGLRRRVLNGGEAVSRRVDDAQRGVGGRRRATRP